jgi:CBS domain-containing protein
MTRIGAVLILGADRRVVGILSERDVVRALAERGAGALEEPVSQTMTRKVSTCNENESVFNNHGTHDRGKIPPRPRGRPGAAGRNRIDR